jgi:predicted nucleic acid-binding protein
VTSIVEANGPPTFLDTNVFVYAVDTADPTKQSVAQNVLATVRPLCLSSQVLSEYYVTVTRKLAQPLDAASAGADVEDMARLEVVPVDAELVVTAAGASQRWRISLWDALIVEAARTGGCERVLSEDLDDGTDFDGVSIVNPFVGDDASTRKGW